MPPSDPMPSRVGYVVKRYPRYSETFIVTEILAHEAAGLDVEIFALYPSSDTHFQDALARVRAPVRYLTPDSPKAGEFWDRVQALADEIPGFWPKLEAARGEEAREVYQGMLLAQQVIRGGIRHLHAHFATSATSVARLASRFAGVPYTFTAHAKDIFHQSVIAADFERKLADAAATVTVSDYNAQHLRETYGTAAAARVRRVYNGMDLGRLRFESPRDRRPLVVSVGRLVEKKGFAELVEACAVLRDRGTMFRCVIVGEGELEAELSAQINSLGLEQVVEMIGPRPQEEVFRIVREAAAFTAPCVVGEDQNRDGLPTVLLEAMALGTPCVSTDVTGIPEVVRDGQTGLLVPQRDARALVAALERLLADPELRVRLAGAARKLIEIEFDARRNTEQLRALFAQAVAAGGARPPVVGTDVGGRLRGVG